MQASFIGKTNWLEHKPAEPLPTNGRWIRNWFSNFVDSHIEIDGIVYKSVEAYYQAQKSLDKEDWIRMAMMDSPTAKREGRKLKIRDDWEEVKFDVMLKALRAKFSINKWKQRLLATGNEVLVEWNNWGDRIWGALDTTGEGKNLLGIALMQIRDELEANPI